MNQLRATHIITSLDADGAQRVLARMLHELGPKASDMDVVSMRPLASLEAEFTEMRVPVHSLEMRRGAPRLSAIARLAKHLRARRPDVIVSWLYHANLISCAVRPFISAAPLIWNIRNDASLRTADGPWSALTIHLGARLSRRYPTKIAYCAESSRISHCKRGYPDDRACVIPNGVDTRRFRPRPERFIEFRHELGLRSDTPLVGMIGRYHPDKDHATFIAAAARIASKHPEACFVLCGRDVTKENTKLSARIAEAGLTNRFHLLGARHDIERIAPAFDIGVSSSRTEAFSNAVAEMMAAGTPCVVTNVGDSARIVGDCGASAPPNSPDLLGDACAKLLAMDSVERAALGVAARRRIQQNYDVATMTKTHYEFWLATARRGEMPTSIQTTVPRKRVA